jgi:DNA-binding NarL/FixJ family response regulator
VCRVVLCDDQDGYRRLVGLALELESDFEVVGEAANGRQAIEMARELAPDVLLLDIAMPVMDGLEALPHIREASPETHVVMLTGIASSRSKEEALCGGAVRYVEKGIDIADLVAQVREVCAS